MDHTNDSSFVECTFIHFGLLESHFVDKLIHKVFVPDPTSLFLAMDVLMDLWSLLFVVGSLGIKALGDLFHVNVSFHQSLWKGQHIIDLCGVPVVE